MPDRPPARPAPQPTSDAPVYSPVARRLHWWTVLLVVVMVPLGIAMSRRGNELNIWDATTNAMYSAHKLLGFVVLWLMVGRLYFRLTNGAPPDEPTIEPWQKAASHLTHWGLYGLLLLIPLAGWAGVTLYGARDVFGMFSLPPIAPQARLDVFGLFSLPAIAPQNQEAAATAFLVHKVAVFLMLLAVAAHVGAAIYHHFIRKDGVLRRMLPSIRRRS